MITKRSKKVGQYDKDGNLIKVHSSMSYCARAVGVKVQNIYKTCNGYKTALNGYYFKFED